MEFFNLNKIVSFHHICPSPNKTFLYNVSEIVDLEKTDQV